VSHKKIRIGICFNGRQTPGGHNIISGLLSDNTTVIGFLNGTKGMFKG
jgi:pyrophosphate--fructose-6-phosphate 1-phosphotransferase